MKYTTPTQPASWKRSTTISSYFRRDSFVVAFLQPHSTSSGVQISLPPRLTYGLETRQTRDGLVTWLNVWSECGFLYGIQLRLASWTQTLAKISGSCALGKSILSPQPEGVDVEARSNAKRRENITSGGPTPESYQYDGRTVTRCVLMCVIISLHRRLSIIKILHSRQL